MTFAIGHVEGGTHGGWRRVTQKRYLWFCNCEGPDGMILRPGYLVRCPDCKATRA